MFDWHEYIRLAESIVPTELKTPADAAKIRSVISRAYYGAFNTAKVYSIKRGLWKPVKKQRPRHGDIWNSFYTSGATTDEKTAAALGQALEDDRQDADYEANLVVLQKMCESAIVRACQICGLLGSPVTLANMTVPAPTLL